MHKKISKLPDHCGRKCSSSGTRSETGLRTTLRTARGPSAGFRRVSREKLRVGSVDCVHVTSSKSQSHLIRFYPILITGIRVIRGAIETMVLQFICLQLSSSIANFVWKPTHFEFRSYGGA